MDRALHHVNYAASEPGPARARRYSQGGQLFIDGLFRLQEPGRETGPEKTCILQSPPNFYLCLDSRPA